MFKIGVDYFEDATSLPSLNTYIYSYTVSNMIRQALSRIFHIRSAVFGYESFIV